MLDEVDGWKPWQTFREHAGEFKDRDAFVDEGVDVLHFIANLLLVGSTTDTELEDRFTKKQARNAARQTAGYAGVGKDDGLS